MIQIKYGQSGLVGVSSCASCGSSFGGVQNGVLLSPEKVRDLPFFEYGEEEPSHQLQLQPLLLQLLVVLHHEQVLHILDHALEVYALEYDMPQHYLLLQAI